MSFLLWTAGFALMLAGWLITVRAVVVGQTESPGYGLFLHCVAGFFVITGALLWRFA